MLKLGGLLDVIKLQLQLIISTSMPKPQGICFKPDPEMWFALYDYDALACWL